eukprot:gene16850-724_t
MMDITRSICGPVQKNPGAGSAKKIIGLGTVGVQLCDSWYFMRDIWSPWSAASRWDGNLKYMNFIPNFSTYIVYDQIKEQTRKIMRNAAYTYNKTTEGLHPQAMDALAHVMPLLVKDAKAAAKWGVSVILTEAILGAFAPVIKAAISSKSPFCNSSRSFQPLWTHCNPTSERIERTFRDKPLQNLKKLYANPRGRVHMDPAPEILQNPKYAQKNTFMVWSERVTSRGVHGGSKFVVSHQR